MNWRCMVWFVAGGLVVWLWLRRSSAVRGAVREGDGFEINGIPQDSNGGGFE